MNTSFGLIALIGSGETALAGGRLYENLARQLPVPLRVAILETPAGFELNSSQVAGKVADFMGVRLRSYQVQIDVIPARKLGSAFSPDDISILAPLLHANMIFMGPGSPTYTVRHLRGTLAWDLLRARHRLGAALVFASAATIAIGTQYLPVYEIYKVGDEISCPTGLDLFGDFRLALSCIPHWNNIDGGTNLDTSRCFVGMERFSSWCTMLPSEHTTLGLDEHTGIIIDFSNGVCMVHGIGSVTILRQRDSLVFPAGSIFSVDELGKVHCPESIDNGIPSPVWKMVIDATLSNGVHKDTMEEIPVKVAELAGERIIARSGKDWSLADSIRRQIEDLGWKVLDTPDGQKIVRQS